MRGKQPLGSECYLLSRGALGPKGVGSWILRDPTQGGQVPSGIRLSEKLFCFLFYFF